MPDPAAPLVALAQSQLEMQVEQNNNYDLIGLGVASLALTLGAIDAALRESLGHLWALPWIPIVMAVFLALGALNRVEVIVGPDAQAMAATYAGSTEAVINVLLLSDLSEAVQRNVLPLRWRALGIRLAYMVLVVGLLAIAPIMIFAG